MSLAYAKDQTCSAALTTEVRSGPARTLWGERVETQWLCYADKACLILLDVPAGKYTSSPAQFEAYSKHHRIEARGGRIRWDIDGGTMNCHAYACSFAKVPEIHRNSWLENRVSEVGLEHQYDEILTAFFDLVATRNLWTDVGGEGLTQALHEGDLVVLHRDSKIVHSAVVSAVKRVTILPEVTVLSKAGVNPVLEAPLEAIVEIYQAPELKFYRRKGP